MPSKKARTTPILVRRARLSFLWAEVLPGFLSHSLPASSPFVPLTRSFLFPRLFESARDGRQADPPLQTPWIAERRQQFWMRYLVQGKLSEVPGRQGWDHLVPLRLDDDSLRVQADGFTGTIFLDRFCYPFGIAIAISLRWDEEVPLEDFVARAWKLTQTGVFSIAGQSTPLSLNALGNLVLTSLRKKILGDDSKEGFRSAQPFSIVTILEASGVDPAASVRQNSSVLNALEILANWPSDRTYLTLPKPDDVCLHLKQSAPAGSALYAKDRGRVVWHPAMFRVTAATTPDEVIDQIRRSSKLGCYHRNLLFASLQTESLGSLIAQTAQLFSQGKKTADLSQSQRDLVSNAARCLVRLYSGDKGNTWRSESMERQINQGFRPSLEAILAQFPVASLPSNPAASGAPPASPAATTTSGSPAPSPVSSAPGQPARP